MSCPDPYRPYDPANAPSEADLKVQNLPSDSEIRGLTSALAASGGGASSQDLALDLVLNQIVEQACLATGATGAAIALTRDGEMVCRATTGRNAPGLGVRLDNAGFSAECLRMGTLQRCDDTETDPRVDPVTCRTLGVRSILVIPLWYWGEFMGIFEIFSPRPNAFGERDEQTLQALAYRVVRHAKQVNGKITGFTAAVENLPSITPDTLPQPTPPEPAPTAVRETLTMPVIELPPDRYSESESEQPAGRSERDLWTTVLASVAIVIACGIVGLMIWRVGWQAQPAKKAAAPPPPAPAYETIEFGSGSNSSPSDAGSAAPDASTPGNDLHISQASKKDPMRTDVLENANGGGLAIYDPSGKLVYGKPVGGRPAAQKPATDSEQPAAKKPVSESSQPVSNKPVARLAAAPQPEFMVGQSHPPKPLALDLAKGRFVPIDPEVADKLLISRVEPDYPDAARQAHLQGSVTLDTVIGADGRVLQVNPITGNPQLADAATTAVRQWKYKPYTVKGRKVAVRTQVNVRFMLAQ